MWTACLTITDQALVSGTSFITTLTLARAVSKEQYGAYVVAFLIMMLLNLVQNALVTKPMTILGATAQGSSSRAYLTALTVCQLLLGAGLAGGVMLMAAWQAGREPALLSGVVFAMGGALLFVQVQDFFRRILFTRMEVSKVLRNDLVCSGVQLSGLLFLWLQQMLSAQAVFWLMALSTGCGAVVGALQCRVVFVADISGLRQALTDNWRFGRWVLGTNVAWYASTQLYLLLAGALLGLRGPAILEASRTIMAPTQILYFATGNVLPSLGARRLHADGPKALRRLVRLVTVAMMIAMGAYGLMVILAPEFLLGLFYGGQYTGYGGVVQLYALMYFLMNSTLVFSLGIDSLARPDRTFLITMCAGVVALVVAFPLVRWWDVYGAALGMVVTQAVVLGGAWCLFEVSLRERAEAITPVGNG